MKHILYILISGIAFVSCKKEEVEKKQLGTITMINAVTDAPKIEAVVNNNPSLDAIDWYGYNSSFLPVGNHNLLIYSSDDKAKHFFDSKIDITAGELYSLYIFGTNDHPQNLLVKEEPFKVYTGNQSGVRVMNLATVNVPVNIVLVEDQNKIQFSNLNYKQSSGFKIYDTLVDQLFTFEARKVSDNSLVTSFTTTLPLHQNMTIVINGNEANNNVYMWHYNHFRYD